MADDLSLLFRLRADNAQAKAAFADTRADVAKLRKAFGSDLDSMGHAAQSTLKTVGESVSELVSHQVPIIGEAVRGVSSFIGKVGELTGELKKGGPETKKLAEQIEGIAKSSGKSKEEVARFLTTFVSLKDPAIRNEAAFRLFGGSVDLIGNKTAKLLPQLEEAGTSLTSVASASEGVGASIAAIAGPIGIAVLAIGAVVLAIGAVVEAVIELSKEIFELAKSTAEIQGRFVELNLQTGISIELLSALEVGARKTGSSIDGMAQSLDIFQRNLQTATEDPTSKAAVALRKLGVDATDTETAFEQTIAALGRMPEGFRQTALALELFGRSGKSLLAIAKETGGDLNELKKQVKDLGGVTTEEAKRAAEFNHQLVDLDIQLRALGTEAIPIVLDVLKDLSSFLKNNHDVIVLLRGVVKGLALAISFPLKIALSDLKVGFELAHPILKAVSETLQAIKSAIEFISGHPFHLPGVGTAEPTATPEEEGRAAAAKAVEAASAASSKAIQKEIEDRQRLLGLIKFMLADEKRQAEERVATAQREFEAGRITREQLLQETLLGNRKKTQAEIDDLKVDRAIKVEQEKLAKDDVAKQTQIGNEIIAIDAQIADKKAALQRSAADLTAKSQLEERKDQLAHEQAQLEILTKGGEDRIARIENEIRAGVTAREVGLKKIEEIENAALVARGQLLKKQLELAGVGPERQVVLDKIAAIENDRTELERKQSARRVQIAQEEAAEKVTILLASAETTGRIAQTVDASRIASLRVQAALRIRTEEATEQAILKIRLAAIDREDDLARIRDTAARAQIDARLEALQEARRSLTTQLEATSSITDPTKRVEEQTRITKALQQNVDEEIAAQGQANKDRDRLDKELNDQLRVNTAERSAIQSQGERDVEDGRQRDLANERQYADDLKQIKQRVSDIERDTARDVIDLMRLHFASRRDIIKAQRDLDLKEEADRHRAATDSINEQKREVDQQIKLLELNLKALRIGTTEEIEQYEHLIAELDKLKQKRLELDGQQDAEDRRNQTRKRRVTDQSSQDERDVEGVFVPGQILPDIQQGASVIDSVTKGLKATLGELKAIGLDAFSSLAQGVNSLVQNYVLLGTTGPAALRKLLAATLAQIAAESAVKAIYWTAQGFADLFFNPARAAADFTAAGLFASIAGVSAVAGRKLAGDLFKTPSGAGSGAGASASGSGQLNPITLGRNQPQPTQTVVRHEHVLRVESNDSHILKVFSRNFRNNGEMREFVFSDGDV